MPRIEYLGNTISTIGTTPDENGVFDINSRITVEQLFEIDDERLRLGLALKKGFQQWEGLGMMPIYFGPRNWNLIDLGGQHRHLRLTLLEPFEVVYERIRSLNS